MEKKKRVLHAENLLKIKCQRYYWHSYIAGFGTRNVVACILFGEEGILLSMGLAIHNPQDNRSRNPKEHFSKKKGRQLAYGRALSALLREEDIEPVRKDDLPLPDSLGLKFKGVFFRKDETSVV